MSAPNQNWMRWSFASFAKHFDGLKQSAVLYVEHTDRDTSLLKDFAEFRMDGPRLKEVSSNFWELEVTINILINSTMDDTDAYKLFKTIGIMSAAFTDTVLAYRYGDDSQQFACYQRVKEPMRINNFGIVDETVRKQQATIEGRYKAEIRV